MLLHLFGPVVEKGLSHMCSSAVHIFVSVLCFPLIEWEGKKEKRERRTNLGPTTNGYMIQNKAS